MKTKKEIIAGLNKRAARCETIAGLYAQSDRLGQLQFLAESIASLEAAKMIDAQPEWAASHLLAAIENARSQGRREAVRPRAPRRPRRVTPKYLLRFAAHALANQ